MIVSKQEMYNGSQFSIALSSKYLLLVQ